MKKNIKAVILSIIAAVIFAAACFAAFSIGKNISTEAKFRGAEIIVKDNQFFIMAEGKCYLTSARVVGAK